MEEETVAGDLWKELSQQALVTPTPEVKSNVMPAIFSGRQTIEKFRDAIVSGYLPLAFYIALFSAFGLNLDRHYATIQLAFIPLSFALAYLLYPLFDFTDLKRVRDIVALFALGLLVSTVIGCAEATLRPSPLRLSFLEQVLDSGIVHLHLTLSTPLFLLSVLTLLAFKGWTNIVLKQTPWYDSPKYPPGRRILALGLLLVPPLLYSGLFLSALPSQEVMKWQKSLTAAAPKNPWLPAFSSANNKRWSDLNLHHPENYTEQALELLRQGQLPTPDSYEIRHIFDSERLGENSSHKVELRLQEMLVGFARGQHPSSNDGNRFLGLALARDELSAAELKELETRLLELQESLPSSEQSTDYFLLGCLAQREREFGKFSFYSWLDRRGATPERLLKQRSVQERIEQWLQLKSQLSERPHHKVEALAFSRSIARLCSGGAPHDAGPLVLPEDYKICLELLLWSTRARLYQKNHGRLPTDRVHLPDLPSDWELREDFDGSVYLSNQDRRWQMRMAR